MKKGVFVLSIIILMLLLFTCGCTQQDDSENGGKTVTMTARELQNDVSSDTDWSTYYTMLYTSLDDGDSLIIQDTVSNISYNLDTDTTTLTFEWIEDGENNSLALYFEGDITITYQPGDKVKISVKIEYVKFSYEDFNFELEIYEEQWVSKEYFKSNMDSGGEGIKPLPQSSIEKE